MIAGTVMDATKVGDVQTMDESRRSDLCSHRFSARWSRLPQLWVRKTLQDLRMATTQVQWLTRKLW